MKKIGIFYGSTTGTTAHLADQIAKVLDVEAVDVHNVANTAPSMLGDYEIDVIGSSTWGSGDVQEDFYDFLDGAQALDLRGHKIALFGTGDESMSDTFCNAVGDIYDKLKNSGAQFIGAFNTEGYVFEHSNAVHDGKAIGLILDEVNHPEMTLSRIDQWAELIKAQM